MCSFAVVYAAEDEVGEVDADLPSPCCQLAACPSFSGRQGD